MASDCMGDTSIPAAAESCDIIDWPRALLNFKDDVQAVNDFGSRCRIFTRFGLVVLILGMYVGARNSDARSLAKDCRW
jgi:hypothetical protein